VRGTDAAGKRTGGDSGVAIQKPAQEAGALAHIPFLLVRLATQSNSSISSPGRNIVVIVAIASARCFSAY
jgi:hypothetical protein